MVGPASSTQPGFRCADCPVRNSSVCGGLEPSHIESLDRRAVRLTFEPGTAMVHQGDAVLHSFNIRSGSVRLFQLMPDGRRLISAFLQAGDSFGLTGAPDYTFSAEAIEASEVCRLSRTDWSRLADQSPGFSRALLQRAMADLAAAHRQMLLLGRKSAVEKLATFLVGLSDRRPITREPTIVPLPMTRTEIADHLGLTIETVSRVLSRLRLTGVIRWSDTHAVTILKKPQLQRLAGDAPCSLAR